MKIIKFSIGLVILLLLNSCLNLDANIFNRVVLQEYLGDAYQGEVEVDLRNDVNYKIDPAFVNYFTYPSESETIYALYIGDISNIKTDTVILYCHGNADHMDNYWSRAKILAHLGGKNRYGVLLMDYRGYGMSTGTPTEQGMLKDVEGALNWLDNNGMESDRLIMYGYSLGSYPATKLSASNSIIKPNKLILEAPFASTEVMVQDASTLNLPYSFFTSQKLNNADVIKNVDQGLLWIHGTIDSFLSIETHGEIVYKNYQGDYGVATRVSGAEHSNIPTVMGIDNYSNKLLEFILH